MVPFCTLKYSLVQAVPTVNTQTSRNIFFFLYQSFSVPVSSCYFKKNGLILADKNDTQEMAYEY